MNRDAREGPDCALPHTPQIKPSRLLTTSAHRHPTSLPARRIRTAEPFAGIKLVIEHCGRGTTMVIDGLTMGIDLPLKILIWRDEQDKTWLAYNDPHWLADRHGVLHRCEGHFKS